jgi:hypothetical protein
VEIEERGDEGACWLFQLREEILILMIESRGQKLTPARRLPATTRSALPLMTVDMSIIMGSIGSLLGPAT